MSKRIKFAKIFLGVLLGIFLFVSVPVLETMAAGVTEYSVKGNVSYLTFSGNTKVQANQSYSAKIALNGGCQMPADITVTVGGTKLNNGYTYNWQTGSITIDGSVVTGDIVISASAGLHQWDGRYSVDAVSSCTERGTQSQHCMICGMSAGSTTVAATGHKFEKYVSNEDATCASNGTKTAKCSNTGCTATNTITDAGSRLKHTTSGRRENEIAATCQKEGYTGDLVCDICGGVVSRGKTLEMTDHNAIIENQMDASCNVDGYTGDSVCRYCNVVLESGNVIPGPDEHEYGEWTIVLEATKFKVGRQERICSVCGIKESELIQSEEIGKVIMPIAIGILVVIGLVITGILVYITVKHINAEDALFDANTDDDSLEEEAEDKESGADVKKDAPNTDNTPAT